jgi:ferrochelatase
MADNCRYELQLQEASRLVYEGIAKVGESCGPWRLVYQSRSGPPSQPWLEPDVNDYLRQLAAEGVQDVVMIPIGFISDHLEIAFDLDTEAKQLSEQLGINMVRASTVGTHPTFISMIRELILERIDPNTERRALGTLGPSHDVCPADCCLLPKR